MRRTNFATLLGCLLLASGVTLADHHLSSENSATGVWKYSREGRNNETRETTLTLIQDGNKLMGTVSGRESDQKISQGKVENGVVSFVYARETERGSFKIAYSGKVQGETLAGNYKMTRGEREFEREFTAKRQAVNPVGKWDFEMIGQGEAHGTIELKKVDGKLVGKFWNDEAEMSFEKLTLHGAEMHFQVSYDTDNGSRTMKQEAAVLGDVIMGRGTSEVNGEKSVREWKATRQ